VNRTPFTAIGSAIRFWAIISSGRTVESAKFGDSVRSKTDRAMRNEVLCKIPCHTICCLIESMEEFGIPVDFAASPS
jgi:hypothetical protein